MGAVRPSCVSRTRQRVLLRVTSDASGITNAVCHERNLRHDEAIVIVGAAMCAHEAVAT